MAGLAVDLAGEPMPEPRRIVYLPPELKLAIVGCVEKHMLKKLRLISREWSMFATPLLFDKVYISPREIDLTVFTNITQHPVLGPFVREVIYDTSRFDEISRQDYFDRLCRDLANSLVDNDSREWPSDHLISTIKSNNTYDVFSEDLMADLYARHKKDDFVKKGYRRWRHYTASEERTTELTVLSRTLTRGIQKSNGVRSFAVIGNVWETHLSETGALDEHFSGPPSVRSWDALHARPRSCFDHEPSEVTFATAVLALRAVKPVVSLSIFKGMVNCGNGLAPLALTQRSADSVFTAFLNVCIHLESFSLTVETEVETEDYTAPKALGVLPRILFRMKNLKRLDLGLSIYGPFNGQSYYNYKQVFPQEGMWLQLVDLEMAGLAIGGYRLVRLLSSGFPKLQNLCLSDIDLTDGSWEGVIEGMRYALHLQSFSLGDELGQLKTGKGDMFKTTNLDMLRKLEEYVVSGGRHPCLPTGVPAEEASNFWLDLCPLQEQRMGQAYFSGASDGVPTSRPFIRTKCILAGMFDLA